MISGVPKGIAEAIDFMIQVIVGSLCFLAVFLAAVLIRYVVHLCEGHNLAPSWLVVSAEWAEIAIWVTDLFVFALFLVSEILKAYRNHIKEWKAPHD